MCSTSNSHSLELEYRVTGLFETLRPGLALDETQQEAIQAALELEKQFKDKLGSHGDVIIQAVQGRSQMTKMIE